MNDHPQSKTKSMSGSSFTIKKALSASAEGAFFTFSEESPTEFGVVWSSVYSYRST